MRILIQRVAKAAVVYQGTTRASIEKGVMALVCAMKGDSKSDCEMLAKKLVKLRIFEDPEGKMNLALPDVNGQALLISQFTLAADTSRGNRPGFSFASPPEEGLMLFEYFVEEVKKQGIETQTGLFGKTTQIELINDGPTTIWIDSKENANKKS